MKFTALLHHLTIDLLRESFYSLKRKAAPGVDGVTWQEYELGVEDRLVDLHGRVHRGAYRAQPSRRVYIEKADGRQRPLGVAALEDKIVQQAVATILNQIYEEDFLDFSYGFRPGRSQHDALDALSYALLKKKVNYVLDADIRGFFDNLDHMVSKSTNAGSSWGAPVAIAHVCGSPVTGLPFVQGSQVAVGTNHNVNVSWELFTSGTSPFTSSIIFAKSTNGGSSFVSAAKASTVHCTGDCFELQGNFRDFQFPAMVLDGSNNPHIFWYDGALQVTDALSFLTGKYVYADIRTVASTNGCTSFGSPVRVNTNVDPF